MCTILYWNVFIAQFTRFMQKCDAMYVTDNDNAIVLTQYFRQFQKSGFVQWVALLFSNRIIWMRLILQQRWFDANRMERYLFSIVLYRCKCHFSKLFIQPSNTQCMFNYSIFVRDNRCVDIWNIGDLCNFRVISTHSERPVIIIRGNMVLMQSFFFYFQPRYWCNFVAFVD